MIIMSKIIVVANIKGGVAKTTTSVFLAITLSKFGKVLLKDADVNGMASDWVRTAEEKGYPVPFDYQISNQRDLPKGLEKYDYVIIDTAGNDPRTVDVASRFSDLLVVPTGSGSGEYVLGKETYEFVQNRIPVRMLVSRVLYITRSFKELQNSLAEDEHIIPFKTMIPQLEVFKTAQYTIPSRPHELREFRELADEIVELLDGGIK